jgi:hypothetical protein
VTSAAAVSISGRADAREALARMDNASLPSLFRTIGRTPAERTTTYQIRRVFEEKDQEERLPIRPFAVPGVANAPATGARY